MSEKITKQQFEAEQLEDSINDTDENGNYPGEAEAGLDAFRNSLEGQLAGYTTEQLMNEVDQRTLRKIEHLKKVTDHLASMIGVSTEAPF